MISRSGLMHQIRRWETFPCKPRAVSRVQRTAILPQVPVIAIIEDDASVRTATQSLVRSLGFAACTFACAEEFMQSPRLNDASCVIADIQMPGMSGVELQTPPDCRRPQDAVYFYDRIPR